jgi:hypothetical protein
MLQRSGRIVGQLRNYELVNIASVNNQTIISGIPVNSLKCRILAQRQLPEVEQSLGYNPFPKYVGAAFATSTRAEDQYGKRISSK